MSFDSIVVPLAVVTSTCPTLPLASGIKTTVVPVEQRTVNKLTTTQ
ncbi:MAG: hypothetical protein O2966_04940 [Proteobacteria bacterium]|nr:hypothetical protein [Pseudomonadota bacterium]